jgi:anaerobic magnesium-protoporphyrin IX monomethyl ester cyclase
MRVLLINPPFDDDIACGKTNSMKLVLNRIPPLGLAYIAAVLEDGGFTVKVCDLMGYGQIKDAAMEFKPDLIGMTSTTPQFASAIRLKKMLAVTMAKIVIGGSHATALPEEALKHFDYAVLGEGEYTFLELAQKISTGKWRDINGLAYRNGAKTIINKPRKPIDDLDSLPLPARHLLPDLSRYAPTPASYKKLPQAHVMTSRGCPCSCGFCDNAIFGRSYRGRSTQNIMKEIDFLIREYGVQEVKFFDDNFTLEKERLYEICDEMKKRKLAWCCLTRTNLVDKNMLKAMRQSGCWQVLFGLESGDPEILKSLGKGTTIEENFRAVRWAQEVGLNIRADFLIGTPLETRESIRKTVRFAKKLNVDFAHFNKFTPYPGTRLYGELVKEGYVFDFTQPCSQLDHQSILYSPKSISPEEFSRLVDKAHREYYLRPSYIIRQAARIRSLTDMERMARGFLAIAGL